MDEANSMGQTMDHPDNNLLAYDAIRVKQDSLTLCIVPPPDIGQTC